jgi:hypothetical protein
MAQCAQHATAVGYVGGLADALGQHIPAGAGHAQVGGAFVLALQIRQQVGAPHLHLVHLGLQVAGHAGVSHRIDVGHRHLPALAARVIGIGHRRTQRQPAPGDAPGALQLERDARDQRLVVVARGAVRLQRGGQHLDAGVGDAQGFTPVAVALALEQPGSEQLDLEQILARPAGRAPDLAQAAPVHGGDRRRAHACPPGRPKGTRRPRGQRTK